MTTLTLQGAATPLTPPFDHAASVRTTSRLGRIALNLGLVLLFGVVLGRLAGLPARRADG